MKANLSEEFLFWLKNKKENDYLFSSDVQDNFALQFYDNKVMELKNNKLLCKSITWFVTNKCDLACEHCGVSANERKFNEISLEQFAKTIPQLKSLGVEFINLSGGEPLLRKDILAIISVLKLCGFKVGMVTNASKLDKLFEMMGSEKIDTLTISIDGLSSSHDSIRGKFGNFSQAIQGIKSAKKNGIKIVAVHTCVYPDNIAELDELKKILFDQGIDQWILRPIFPTGRASNKYEMSYQQIIELLYYTKNNIEKGYDITIGSDLGYLGKLDSILYLSPFFCSVGWDSMIILPNGDIKGFDEKYLPIEGNILYDSLTEVWNTGFKYYRNPNIPDSCLQCEYYPKCRGGFIPGAEIGKRCIKPILDIL